MARAQRKNQKAAEAKSSTVSASQGSDDAVFTNDIVHKMEAKWNKTRKDKESKFISILQRDVDDALETRHRSFAAGINQINSVYDKFQVEYAALEDEIRRTWLQIAEVVNNLKDSSNSLATLHAEAEEARAEDQLQAIVLQQASIDAFDRQIKAAKDKLKTV